MRKYVFITLAFAFFACSCSKDDITTEGGGNGGPDKPSDEKFE